MPQPTVKSKRPYCQSGTSGYNDLSNIKSGIRGSSYVSEIGRLRRKQAWQAAPTIISATTQRPLTAGTSCCYQQGCPRFSAMAARQEVTNGGLPLREPAGNDGRSPQPQARSPILHQWSVEWNCRIACLDSQQAQEARISCIAPACSSPAVDYRANDDRATRVSIATFWTSLPFLLHRPKGDVASCARAREEGRATFLTK
jgi:hypothetical protein